MLSTKRSPLLFFLLVFALSSPVWLIGAVSRWLLLPGVPASGIMAMCPALAAALLIYREGGISAITTLFKRSFDYTCITNSVWLLPMLLLMPAVMFISYAAMRLFELPLPVVEINWSTVPLLFLAIFFVAFTEELGWSGYVLDPLLDWWSALRASLILGSMWAAWHIVPLQQAGRATIWIAWWCLATVALRILHTWFYRNTGNSILGQALFHASFNTSWQLFPNNGRTTIPRSQVWSSRSRLRSLCGDGGQASSFGRLTHEAGNDLEPSVACGTAEHSSRVGFIWSLNVARSTLAARSALRGVSDKRSRVNYVNTFIAVAPDTSAKAGTVPPGRSGKKSIAQLEYELISGKPYKLTQEEVQFSLHVQRQGVPAAELKARRTELWAEFFSKPMACMRASPLPKSYGWGLHFDAEGKVALVAMESPEYKRRLNDSGIRQLSAMRSKRA